MSDVVLSENGPTPFKQFGYQLTITQRTLKFLNTSLELYAGTVYGEKMVNQTNLNFRTSLFSQRISFEYNFYPLLKPTSDGRQLIRPYVGFGIGMVSFRSKGDLENANGIAYQFWSNGSIYAEQEESIDETEATALERDFVYESDLRDADLDGFGKYSQLTFSMPFNAGIRFQVSKNVGVNAAFSYSLNFTDMIDNVSNSSIGDRKGNSGYDNQIFGSIGLSVFLGNVRPTKKQDKIDHAVAESESIVKSSNSDSSEIESTEESSTEYPLNESGIIADSSDSKLEVAPSMAPSEVFASVSDKSNLSESQLEKPQKTDVEKIEKSRPLDSLDFTDAPEKEVSKFHWADLNSNGWISLDEVLHFIDQLFEGDGDRDVEDIQNLIDYYFDQE